ncbi:MAG: AmmeMemoRadiSam system protein B [Candidatus Buchananbacteria bacterium]|nr:AmmeMemoRadiSam system protein B [Candidatus Buchananbacteria bacterium]
MSLVFAAIVPHPPILIPSIGKEHVERIAKTKAALARLEQDLYATKPEVLIIISPHGDVQPELFTINLASDYEVNFEAFGDFATRLNFKGDTVLMTLDKERISSKSPTTIISESKLDHGVGIPLFMLAQHLPGIRVIPMYFSLLDNQSHLEFGKSLKEVIMNSDKRVAVIASADLSHCVTENAPLPYKPQGKVFDETILSLLEKRDSQAIVNIDPKLIDAASECGLRSILILLGAVNNINYRPEILSYEAPFGVGYLTATLHLD